MMEAGTLQQQLSSPSFSSYSSETLAQIAARVIDELRRDPHSLSLPDHDTLFDSWEEETDHDHGDHHEDDFEFASVSRDPNSSPVSADDIFYNGQIRPIYPLFDRSLLFADINSPPTPATDAAANGEAVAAAAGTRRRRPPLRKLMFEERETVSCSSSTSEADDNNELRDVAAGTYCVWTPKSDVMERPCKKSNSTGSSSKRWKLRDLLLRSHSDGKEPFLFVGPSKRTNQVAHEVVVPKPSSADNASKERDQSLRKSFLPFRQDLIGLFTNVNGVGRNLHPF